MEEDRIHRLLALGGRRLAVGIDAFEFGDDELRDRPQGLSQFRMKLRRRGSALCFKSGQT